MKHLNAPSGSGDWQNELIRDLAYIKAHKRYKLGKKTIAPASIIALLLLTMARLAWPFIFLSFSAAPTQQSSLLQWIFSLSIAFLLLTVVYSFFKVLKFETLKTPQFMQENIILLHKFFTQNRLAYTQHPEAPEVFMIISRNLDANPKKDYREVMVFIADDKQILVNSHFTGKKFNITPPSRNYRRMARELQKWLNDEQIKNNDNSLLPVNSL
ncbi:MAG: hypothetical protein H3C54_07335 [Taibaiella sp.]|nr:hypothetical protein [Taibaiella sp.]